MAAPRFVFPVGLAEVEPNDRPWDAPEFESDTVLTVHSPIRLDCFKYSARVGLDPCTVASRQRRPCLIAIRVYRHQ